MGEQGSFEAAPETRRTRNMMGMARRGTGRGVGGAWEWEGAAARSMLNSDCESYFRHAQQSR